MISLLSLWLPILIAAVAVFVVSSLIHMLPTWHRSDYPRVPRQDDLMEAVRPFAIPPGDYMMPRADDMKDMQSPEFIEKMKRGPVMMLTVVPNGPPGMARSLVLWFAYVLLVSVFTAYVTGRALGPGADAIRVAQLAGTTAFVGYAVALWQMSIWYRRAWSLTLKATLDGAIYGVVTALVFAWLWPAG